jgi:hypothetical protein
MEKVIKIFGLCLILTSFSCQKGTITDCFTGKGDEEILQFDIENFTKIHCASKINIALKQDTNIAQPSVEITGPENVIRNVVFDVSDGRCNIFLDMTCHFVRSYNYDINLVLKVKNIDEIVLNAAAQLISLDTIFVDDLYIKHLALSDMKLTLVANDIEMFLYNAAHLNISGKANSLKGYIEHNADLDARNLDAQKVLLDHHSPLDSYFRASKLIYVNLHNDGNFYYYGDPTEYVRIDKQEGNGKLIKVR